MEIVLLLLGHGASLGEDDSNRGRPWRHVKTKKSSRDKVDVLVDHDGLTPISFLTSLPSMKQALAISNRSGGEVYSFGSETADFQLG